jgi:hypothetical protein
MAKQQRNYRLPDRTLSQLSELVNGGYCNDETAAIVEAVNSLYYHRVEQANEITIASRKVAEHPVSPEVIDRGGELWLNLGSGLLAESAVAILAQQFGDDARCEQDAVGDWLIWHRTAGQDAYALFKCIIMFRL